MRKYIVLILIVVLPVAFAFVGRYASPVLARVHPTVALAWEVHTQENTPGATPTVGTLSVGKQQRTKKQLFEEAAAIYDQFHFGSTLLGIWCGLVIAFTIFELNRTRRRVIYEVNCDQCVACGRCFASCPVGQKPKPADE